MTRRILITIEYDGGPFVGWQRQTSGLTVQQVLEDAAAKIAGVPVLEQGAGRTDSGVHATGQVAHLDVPEKFSANRVMQALNALTGDHPVTVCAAREVNETVHARFTAIGRRYLYRILPRRHPPALDHGRVWHHRKPLDAEAMNRAAQHLVGRHDFTSFRATHCQAESPIRTLDELRIEACGEEIHLHAYARSFLHHQVRNIVGTLALVGTGKWQERDVVDALAACDRSAAGPTAPPEGLYLSEVVYPSES
ncbi:MAG: tRNA pseudouridine(38-40) synthase TruA [Bacteroidetes bacterium]|nr:tRNA pseudouridine(38-40) synthase TruA [Bacteroidota bacterium]